MFIFGVFWMFIFGDKILKAYKEVWIELFFGGEASNPNWDGTHGGFSGIFGKVLLQIWVLNTKHWYIEKYKLKHVYFKI